ncbi:pyrroloquinoline quinone precursor peptide PqqA [Siccirubricoccus phaeus]|nr:pyrroloquinoline quinone precursor peptide PqqA [Siccirubricoccus phaeus]
MIPAPAIARLRWPETKPEDAMAWKTPRVTEISLALEINAYACAELG